MGLNTGKALGGWKEWGLQFVALALLWARRTVLQRLQNPQTPFFDVPELTGGSSLEKLGSSELKSRSSELPGKKKGHVNPILQGYSGGSGTLGASTFTLLLLPGKPGSFFARLLHVCLQLLKQITTDNYHRVPQNNTHRFISCRLEA